MQHRIDGKIFVRSSCQMKVVDILSFFVRKTIFAPSGRIRLIKKAGSYSALGLASFSVNSEN